MSQIQANWKTFWVILSAKLYRSANKIADGKSFNAYILALICRDLDVAFETLDYDTLARPNWNPPPKATKKQRVLIPPGLLKQLKAKVKGLPYPVVLSAYVRHLIEMDVKDGKGQKNEKV